MRPILYFWYIEMTTEAEAEALKSSNALELYKRSKNEKKVFLLLVANWILCINFTSMFNPLTLLTPILWTRTPKTTPPKVLTR